MDTRSTALILFARNAKAESLQKELLSDSNKNLHLHQKLLSHSKGIAKKTLNIPLYHFDETIQKGTTFGDRFVHAVETVFGLGHDRVIIIGSDCPDIESEDILKAIDALNHASMVAGPDQRGGAYLIGLNREAFKPELLERLPWQTPHLLNALCSSFSAHCLLSEKKDLNQVKDVVLSSSRTLLQFFKELFEQPIFIDWCLTTSLLSQRGSSTFRRGPPQAA